MKKTVLAELEIRIREMLPRFYTMAYSVTGEREGAEKLTEDAVIYGARRYGDLMNKARFSDIVEQKLGIGKHVGFEPTDYDLLCHRIMTRVRAWNTKSIIGKWLGTTAVIFAVIAGAFSLIFPKLYEAKSKEVPLMKDTLALGGDYDISELVNYQRVSEHIDISQKVLDKIQYSAYAKYFADIVTAPDGTPYLLINNMETMSGYSTTFTLYQGSEDGWKAVGTGNIGAGYRRSIWWPSELYTFADNDSDAYVALREAENILIYRYDNETETFEKTATIPFRNTYSDDDFTIHFDPDFGETGTAYVACRKDPPVYDDEDKGGLVMIFRYDTATDTVSLITDELRLVSEYSRIDICAKNDIVYCLETITNQSTKLMVMNAVYPDGYVEFDFFENEDSSQMIYCMAFDKDGKLHVVTYDNRNAFHYVFSDDLTFTKGELGMSYRSYEDTDYSRSIIGSFVGKDGRIYCLERYYDSSTGERSFLAIGMLDADDPSKFTYINGFDLLDNLGYCCYVSGKDIWHITTEYDIDKPYMVYFHINELD